MNFDEADIFYHYWYLQPMIEKGCESPPTWHELTVHEKEVWNEMRKRIVSFLATTYKTRKRT